jgi:hypothetical protein
MANDGDRAEHSGDALGAQRTVSSGGGGMKDARADSVWRATISCGWARKANSSMVSDSRTGRLDLGLELFDRLVPARSSSAPFSWRRLA